MLYGAIQYIMTLNDCTSVIAYGIGHPYALVPVGLFTIIYIHYYLACFLSGAIDLYEIHMFTCISVANLF